MCEDGGKRYSNGTIRVLGINTTHTLAGRIEICVETEWWAVCENGWGSDDASAVCRRLGFTECKLFNPTFTQLHSNIVFFQLSTAQTPALVRVHEIKESENSSVLAVTVVHLQEMMIPESVGRMQE